MIAAAQQIVKTPGTAIAHHGRSRCMSANADGRLRIHQFHEIYNY
jgi:hypothetical protein